MHKVGLEFDCSGAKAGGRDCWKEGDETLCSVLDIVTVIGIFLFLFVCFSCGEKM